MWTWYVSTIILKMRERERDNRGRENDCNVSIILGKKQKLQRKRSITKKNTRGNEIITNKVLIKIKCAFHVRVVTF